MRPSHERTNRMEQIFEKMRNLAAASYPLLDELAHSPSPGERLAAVAILKVFAAEESFPFLVKLIGSEKPFVGYQATKALRLAVGSLDPIAYPRLLDAIHEAQVALKSASIGFDSDREALLSAAEQELTATTKVLFADAETYE